MAILYVAERGTKVESSLTASMTVTLSATTSINNHLFLILGARAGDTGLGTNPISSIADGRGNSWSVNSFGWNDSENSIVAIASCLIATPNQAGDTLTIDFTHAVGAGRAATLQEFSGIRSADQAGAASNPSSVDVSVSTNMSTDTADELVLMSATGSGTGTPWTVGVNYLEFTTKAQSDGVRTHYGEYRIVAATAIQTATATMPAPNTGWTAAIATFRASTPGPEDNPPIGFLGRGAGW